MEGEGSTSTGARAGRDGVESSRSLSLGGRRKLRAQRGVTSSRRPRAVETTAPVITIVSSGDEGSGDDRGRNHGGGTSSRIQQALPDSPRGRRTGNQAVLTPNFRSAAAMAGWDDEALLSAAIGRGTPEGPSCTNSCEGCPQCRERKRGTRTPGLAATPLSAGRRYRRVRRVNEEPLVPIPMAGFADEGDKPGEPAREAEGSHQQRSDGAEVKDSITCAKSTSVKAAAEAAEGNSVKNNSLQLDKLREELTCGVCLDICFEPSTTSCGHSFCRGCLQSVYIKCGLRCPKCRQELSTSGKNDCPINTVLWNTIQLLFPLETAARLKDQKNCREDNRTLKDSAKTVEADSQHRVGLVRRRFARPVPWRELGTTSTGTEHLRLNVGGPSESFRGPGIRASFRRASEMLESTLPASNYPPGFLQMQRSLASWRNPEIRRQEEEDAALAARLQESFITEEGRSVFSGWLFTR